MFLSKRNRPFHFQNSLFSISSSVHTVPDSFSWRHEKLRRHKSFTSNIVHARSAQRVGALNSSPHPWIFTFPSVCSSYHPYLFYFRDISNRCSNVWHKTSIRVAPRSISCCREHNIQTFAASCSACFHRFVETQWQCPSSTVECLGNHQEQCWCSDGDVVWWEHFHHQVLRIRVC